MRSMRLLFHTDEETPLGRLLLAGFYYNDENARSNSMQVAGCYALAYLLEGSGFYQNANHYHQKVKAGDCLFFFPGLAVRYGPGQGERWSDFIVQFDGPAFELWQQAGLLNPASPVHHLEPVDHWQSRFSAIFETPRPLTVSGRTVQLCHFLSLLTEISAFAPAQFQPPGESHWLAQTRTLLESNLGRPLDLSEVAQTVGMSYSNLRRSFQRETGVSPARYRAAKHIDAACLMLRSTDMTHRAIAMSLGFTDETHFYKRFKQLKRITPREYRQNQCYKEVKD